VLRRHCKLLRYRIRYYYHVFCQLYDYLPELLRACIRVYWYRYSVRKSSEHQSSNRSADHIRVSIPSEVSPHSSPTSFCQILLEGSTPWHTETLYSCKRLICPCLSVVLIISIGAIISANSKSFPMLLGGRWLTGFGCSTAALSAKTYLAEITSPKSRGRYMGVLNSFYYGEFSRFFTDHA
jgi:hypothetical protein